MAKDQLPQAETILAEDIHFNGTLKFSSSVRINGTFEGEIVAEKGSLIVGSQATVKAKIEANEVHNYGKIIGNVSAGSLLSISEHAELLGDISTNGLIIHNGGVLNGQCTMPFQSIGELKELQ